MSDLTANQHYVWQHYLRAWCAPKKIWCKRIDKPEPFETTTRNVGAERFFYEFQELTSDDFAYLENVISRSNDERLRTLNRGWIESVQMTFAIRRRLSGVEMCAERRVELEAALHEIERTMGESFHGATEKQAIPILNALRRGDVSFYDDEPPRLTFIDFISHQYFRTAKLRNAVTELPNPLPHDMNRTWPVEAFIFATNLASSFVRQQRDYRIVLLRNRTEIPFITGDQPVINLRGFADEEVDLYYPLQPNLAMIYTADRSRYPSDEYEPGVLAIEHYNHLIHVKSGSQIYGNDGTYLASVARLPKVQEF